MKHYFILILLASALGIWGCESDLVSNNQQNTPKYNLEVIPDTLHGSIYEQYTFKARLNGMASSDVAITWDFGDSNYYRPPSHSFHEYYKPGNYTITVKAFDSFRDTLLATKTVLAFITSNEYTVDLTPNSTDTILSMNSDGSFKEMTFSFTTSFPLSRARAYWSFSDGLIDTFTYNYSSITHRFKTAGTYKVKVTIKDDADNLIGEDSSTITISAPSFGIAELQSARKVSVVFALDSTSPVYRASGFVNPIQFALNMDNNTSTTSSWSSHSFSGHYHRDELIDVSGGQVEHWTRKYSDYDIMGTISNDLKKVESLTVSVFDSTLEYQQSSKTIDMGFTLKDIDFIAITDNEILYAVHSTPLSSFSSDIHFTSKEVQLGPCGSTDPIQMHYIINANTKLPYAYVVFTRK